MPPATGRHRSLTVNPDFGYAIFPDDAAIHAPRRKRHGDVPRVVEGDEAATASKRCETLVDDVLGSALYAPAFHLHQRGHGVGGDRAHEVLALAGAGYGHRGVVRIGAGAKHR